MINGFISVLEQSRLPPPAAVKKWLEIALVKKMGVISLPYQFWHGDRKINPSSKHLLWAAILVLGVAFKRDVDDPDPNAASGQARAAAATVKPVKAPEGKGPKATGKPSGKRVVVRKPSAPARVTPGAAVPLEETLEILGASTLTIDESREIINDSAIRSKPEPKKKNGAGGRLSRLLNRLGGG